MLKVRTLIASSPAYGIGMISRAILMQISIALDVIVINEIIRRYPARDHAGPAARPTGHRIRRARRHRSLGRYPSVAAAPQPLLSHYADRDVFELRGRLRRDRSGIGRLREGRARHRVRARGV